MEKSKVSVIVPVYNAEKYLKKCLESIINQTYLNIEIVLVDDGSTDNSLKICNDYKKNDRRIKVIHQSNKGVSTARNVGLDNATGAYISFVDSDDYIENDMIEKMTNEAIKNNLDIIICNLHFENENYEEIKEFNHNDYFIKRKNYPIELYKNISIQGYSCNKIFKRNIIVNNNIRFKREYMVLEDDLFNYDIFYYNKELKIKYINNKFYHYVQLNTGASKSAFNLKKLSYLDVREKEINILNNENIISDHLKADYITVFIRMKHLAKKNKTYSKEIFDKYIKNYREYKKSLVFKNLNHKQQMKYIIINYLPLIYYLKLIINGEK